MENGIISGSEYVSCIARYCSTNCMFLFILHLRKKDDPRALKYDAANKMPESLVEIEIAHPKDVADLNFNLSKEVLGNGAIWSTSEKIEERTYVLKIDENVEKIKKNFLPLGAGSFEDAKLCIDLWVRSYLIHKHYGLKVSPESLRTSSVKKEMSIDFF